MEKIIKGKKRYLIPAVHFLLSFLYERCILIFELDRDVVLNVPRNYVISDQGERILGYVLSKLFALAIIFCLWSLIFWVIAHWKERKNLRLFLALFLVGGAALLLLWPEPFIASEDNYITYTYALRFWPEYWHSAYSGCIFAAILMTFPHPVFLTVFQYLFGVFALGYLYNRILDSPVLKGRGRYGVFLVLLMPGVYRFFTNSYRTESYGLLCVFLISMTAMDIVDQRKRGIPELVLNLLLCAFVGVWRTEGIILGVLLFLVQLLFIYRLRPRKSILCFLGLLLAFGLFSVPQKLGDIKYYGKDYSFINSLPTLKNILASPKSNLSYDGVTEDLEALGAVTPVEILRYYGMEGYRRYNYANGRGDINQSLADDETAAAYMRAYYRMVAHNLPIYAKTQISMLLNMLMIKPYYYVEYSDQLPVNDLPPWKLMTWEYGKEDLNDAAGVTAWKNSRLHILCVEVASKIGNFISGILRRIHFYSLVLVAIPLYEIFIFFHEGIRLLKKKKNRVGLALIAFILLGQAAAIILVMPAAALNYLHPYYYCSFALCLIYTCCIWSRKKETGKTEGEIWKK